MAPIVLKVKGDSLSSPFGDLSCTEDLSKTWRVCTKVKDSLENGSRLENLSWRLWYAHNSKQKKKKKPAARFEVPEHFDFSEPKKTVQEKEIEYRRKLKKQQQKQAQQTLPDVPHVIPLHSSHVANTGASPVHTEPSFKNYIYTEHAPPPLFSFPTEPLIGTHWPIEQNDAFPNTTDMGHPLALQGGAFHESSALYVSADSMPPLPIGTLHNRILASLPKETLASAERLLLSSQGTTVEQQPMPLVDEFFWESPLTQSTPNSPFFASFPQHLIPQAAPLQPYTSSTLIPAQDTNCQSKSLPASRAPSPSCQPPMSPLSPFHPQHKKTTGCGKRSPVHPSSPADGKAPICSNCHTTTTPLWRRSAEDELLCNACGLYLKLHNTPRPKHFKPQSLRKDSKDEESLIQPVCSNCSTSTTPLWRRDAEGQPLCNACGLYLKLHHEKRPLSMKTDNIKKRQRTEHANHTHDAGKSKKKTKPSEDNENTFQFLEGILHPHFRSEKNCTA
ncbi:hypothetical protein BY458DRAFT_516522 [Sporodiniella umbellata]|nr:hypothetical protein BY458DRAFT_516522 [Sporodiniella umbellata]